MSQPHRHNRHLDSPLPPLLFECGSVEVGTRTYPHIVNWRAMPVALVLQVRGGMYVIDFRDERRSLRDGDAAIIPPETEHRIHMPRRGAVTVLYSHVSFTTPDGMDLFTTVSLPRVVGGDIADRLGEVNKALVDCMSEMEPGLMRTARTQELGFRMLQLLLTGAKPGQLEAGQPGGQRLMPVLRYVARNLDRKLTRSVLARQASLSPTRFHDVFKSGMGMAPMEYVQRQRMNRAKRMLLNTDLSIYQVALRSGFEDPYYFSRIFRKTQGRSPSSFRTSVRDSGL